MHLAVAARSDVGMVRSGNEDSFFAEADGSHQWTGQLDQFAENLRDLLLAAGADPRALTALPDDALPDDARPDDALAELKNEALPA